MTRRDVELIADILYNRINKNIEQLVIKQLQIETDGFITIKQASDYLQLSVSYIRKNLNNIPHKKIGSEIRFTKQSLREWVESLA